jgi:hypothetical protein
MKNKNRGGKGKWSKGWLSKLVFGQNRRGR